MPNYRLIPTEPESDPIEVEGAVPSGVLWAATQRGIMQADLYDGERYVLTLRRDGPINACWTIITDPEHQDA